MDYLFHLASLNATDTHTHKYQKPTLLLFQLTTKSQEIKNFLKVSFQYQF